MTIWKPEDYLQFPVGVMLTVIGGTHSKEHSTLCMALMIQEISSDTKRNSSLIKGTTKGTYTLAACLKPWLLTEKNLE